MTNRPALAEFSAFLILLFAGFAGLLYEIIWIRKLAFIFGVTTYSMSVVVSAFMLGLGVGNYTLGRFIDKSSYSPFKFFALCQLFIGLYGIVSVKIVDIINFLYLQSGITSAENTPLNLTIRATLSILFLFPPTFFMGAGLPVLMKAFSSIKGRSEKFAGKFYGADTLGGALGCIIPPFILFPRFGIHASLYMGAFANLCAACLALIIAFFLLNDLDSPRVNQGVKRETEISTRKYVLLIYAFSGFAVMGYEIIWTRIVSVILVSTVYSYALILAAFLIGLSMGGFLITRLSLPIKKTAITLVFVQILLSLSAVAITLLFGQYQIAVAAIHKALGQNWLLFQCFAFLTLLGITGIATLCAGLTFPLTIRLYRGSKETIGLSTGRLLFMNAFGCISGSLTAGFLLLPLFGINDSILLLALFNISAAFVAFFYTTRKQRILGGSLIAAATLILLLLYFIDITPTLLKIHERKMSSGTEIVHYDEGVTGTIAVSADSSKNVHRIWINGSNAAAVYYGALQTEKAQGHLAFLAHPQPEDVCLICFGTGSTLGSIVCDSRVKQIDLVEIAPEVIEAAHYFKKFNYDALDDARVNLIIGDGRNHLLLTEKKYDIITSEPMHPSLSGTINLYTTDYYRLCAEKLKPDGIISQWIPLYQMDISDVKSLTAAFQEVFPYVAVWLNYGDIILLGSNTSFTFDLDYAFQRLSETRVLNDLEVVSFEDPYELAASFSMFNAEILQYIKGIEPVTDNFPHVEFSAPASIDKYTDTSNLVEIMRFRAPFPIDFYSGEKASHPDCLNAFTSMTLLYNGLIALQENNPQKALDLFRESKEKYPTNKRLEFLLNSIGWEL